MDSEFVCCDKCNSERVIPARLKLATEKSRYEEMCASYESRIEKDGFTHYRGRAECFTDVVNAFHIITENNLDNDTDIVRIILPTIKSYMTGDTDFDFWTDTPLRKIQTLWDTQGYCLHRMVQTTKPIAEYDGQIDLSFWDKPKSK